MNQKKLSRSINNRKIAGVCGGLGEHLNVDPLVFRIIFLVLLFGGGAGLLIYLLLWIVMPEDKINIPYETFHEPEINDVNSNSPNKNCMKKNNGIFWGLLFVAFGLLWLGRSFGFFHFYWYNVFRLWPLLIIWVGVSLLPIERIWKNVCSVIILAFAIVLIFLLPAGRCCGHFWDDDFGYEIRKKFRNAEYTINERINSEITIKELNITDNIKGVIIEGPWEVTITQDDTNNSAAIEYNIPESKITTELRSNGYLLIKANSLSSCRNKTLNATIHAGSLEKIKASGAASIKTYGDFSSNCDISLSGASKLDGLTCKGDNSNISLSGASRIKNFTFHGKLTDIEISGASKIDISGMNVNRLKVNASGASHINGDGYAEESSVLGSGASHFNFYDLESDNLTINLSGASSAEATVNKTIKGTLTGASTLRYKNAENVRDVSATGGSKVVHVN
jgi:phage shock protein PspC (stress-responsive transcriptional regulator)